MTIEKKLENCGADQVLNYKRFVDSWKEWINKNPGDLEMEIRKSRAFSNTPTEVLVNNSMKCFPGFVLCDNESDKLKDIVLREFGIIKEGQTVNDLKSDVCVSVENTRRPAFERKDGWVENLETNIEGVYLEVEQKGIKGIKMFLDINILKKRRDAPNW